MLLSEHPLYGVFYKMHQRCDNKNHPQYKNYGGRGIKVCDEWKLGNASAFVSWGVSNGWSYGLQLDRIDNNKDYSPDNCRFVTRKENCRNKSNNKEVVVNGEKMLLCEAIERYCVVSMDCFKLRYYHFKRPLEKALFKPSRKRKKSN